ncbi:hypothetical protein Ade02nite_09030 [Paractinoplanes deccanensis]|uniref:Adhesin domain-containing protein n=1 Tax=Paractinoplanes deccanensis TaxID=113561 RepID=A0ABQ3XX76_9ACTN|nr:hypothetical protein [Actinoplanes deccanensis]GID72262.1 hypothetical protein Ade02nite_09030 [Actinoplanes deccanensis]
MRLTALFPLLLLLPVAGCTDLAAIDETSDDRQEFALAGERLVIDNDGVELRLTAGTGDAVVVQRSLTGKATVDGNASWSMRDNTLRLSVSCSGFVPDCGGRHVVGVPPGVEVQVTSDSPVRAVGLGAALTATVSDSWLHVESPGGPLRLDAGLAVEVTGARSADVAVSSRDDDVRINFTSPPSHVEARAAGSVDVVLPAGPETYRVTATPGGSALRHDPASKRSISATAGDAHAARVRKAR